jgi:uncharacterized membrane protein YkgB
VLAALRYVAIGIILVAMAMLVAFLVTSQKRLLTGGILGVLIGGATLSYLRRAEQDHSKHKGTSEP